jgi:hypothetical protein
MRTCRRDRRRGGRLLRSRDVSIFNYGTCADSGAATQTSGAGHGRLIGSRVGREDIARLGVEAGDGTLSAGGEVLLELLDVVDHDGDGGQESLGDTSAGLAPLTGVQGGVDGLQPAVAAFDVGAERR